MISIKSFRWAEETFRIGKACLDEADQCQLIGDTLEPHYYAGFGGSIVESVL